MNPNNSNEFDLGVANNKLQLPPLKMLVNQQAQGYFNPLQMPNITPAQKRALEKSIKKEGENPDV